jgi:site-specific DNA recombinase
VQAIRAREESLAFFEGRLRGLRRAPNIIGLETRRMEKEARQRMESFQQLVQASPPEAKRVLEALLDKPLVFTPTPQNNYVIEGPVFLGALLPKSCDPSGIRTRVHALKGHCPRPS